MIEPLITWFLENQRPLPWRATYDPYHIWVSEVMLQQTQVEIVLPYYDRFIRRFPDVRALAAADEDQVLKIWAGLGYYRRAKNLLAAARAITEQSRGTVPSDYESLRALPGVGQYMAGAILSIAFNKPYPVVDGNVRRVLSRLHGWTEDRPKRLWDAATVLARAGEPRIVNQAVMELGAKICSFKGPKCLLCPVQSKCVAFKTGLQDSIPPVKKRPGTVRVQVFAIVQQRGPDCLMKRANGLWEPPMFSDLPQGSFSHAGTCHHTITHHRLTVSVYVGRLDDDRGYTWVDPQAVAISSLTRKVLGTVVATSGRS
jgi:A/G-specific adenine glycosylase